MRFLKYYRVPFFAVFLLLFLPAKKMVLAQVSGTDKHFKAQIDSVNTLPYVFITSRPEVAEPLLLANAALADSIGYTYGTAKSNAQLGIIYHYLGKQDLRIEHILNAIKLYQQIDSTRLAGYQYTELGYGIKHRNLKLAENYMMKGISLLNDFPGSITQADAFNNYGIIKLMKQEYDSALFYITRSLEIKENENDLLGASYSLGNLSEVYLGMGEYDEAIKRLNHSYSIRKELQDSTAMGFDLLNLGLAYNRKADYNAAIQYFKQALQIALETNYTGLAENSFNRIANNFELLAQFDSALFYHKNYTIYKDSLLNLATNNRVAELQVQFETEEKEKQIALTSAALSIEQLKVRKRNWIVSILGLLMVSGIVIYLLLQKQQRIKRENEQREIELELKLANVAAENKIRMERERISRDLHDNVGSQITNIITGIEIGTLLIKQNDTQKAQEVLINLDTEARNTMTDLRSTVWLLEKETVTFDSFLEYLKSYFKRQEYYLDGLIVHIYSKVDALFSINPAQSLNITRIIQEVLNNTRKHANAKNFDVHFIKNEDQLTIKIKDDGKGFDANELSKNPVGNGLNNMCHRARLMGGNCTVKSDKKRGTSVLVSLPLYPQQGITDL